MAATIKIKNSSTASAVPTSSDLVQGELAVNVTDKRLFTENASGTVVELGTNPSTLTVTSGATIQGLTVGRGAGAVSTNTAVGASALAANTTGANNTAIGQETLQASTTTSRNTAVGYRAGYNHAYYDATFIGYQSGYSNTSGAENTSVGHTALYANTSGSNNTAMGKEALYANTTGTKNTSVGNLALYSNTTASQNTAVGYQAGYSNTTGANLVALGYQAGYSSNANNNTFIGYYAGQGTTGTLNTFVGVNGVGYLVSSGTKNTIIGGYSGNQGGLDIRTASNYIVLSDGDGNPQAYCVNNSSWTFGKGGTGATYDGFITLNGTNATNYGPVVRFSNNGTYMADIGDYANIATSATHQFAIRCGASGGVYLAATATSWSAISDETQKNIIEPITNGLNKVASLRAVIGSYKSDEENTRHPFLIAQDVQAVLPEAVSQNDHDGETILGLAYTDVIPLLVAAIKELKAEIDTLKGQA